MNAVIKVEFHVFADGYDAWYEHESEALADYNTLVAQGSNARLWVERYESLESLEALEPEDEECLASNGSFPR